MGRNIECRHESRHLEGRIMMPGVAAHVLICGAHSWGADAGSLCDAPRLDRVDCADETAALAALERALSDETPVEVVAAPASHGAAQFIDPVLAADPLVTIIVYAARPGSSPAHESDRVIALPPGADWATLAQIAAAAAKTYWARATLQGVQGELDATHRAYRAVAGEFQRQNARIKEHEEQLNVQNQLFDTALKYMSQGLCMFDAAGSLMVCNERYIEIYGLSPDVAKPGCSLRDLLEHRNQRARSRASRRNTSPT